jgi:hypothetical protein
MPDDPKTPAGDPPAGDPPAADPPTGDPSGTELPEGAKKALAAARKDAADAEKRAKAAEARAKEYEDRDKSEAEKAAEARATAERERDAARAEVAQIRRDGWVVSAAAGAKFIDPDEAVALLARAQIDDADAARSAVEQLAKDKPHLVGGPRDARPGSFGGGQRGGGGSGGGATSPNAAMNDAIRGLGRN